MKLLFLIAVFFNISNFKEALADNIPYERFNTFTYWQECRRHLGEPPRVHYFDSVAVPMPQTDVNDVNHPTKYLAWADNIPRGSTERQYCDKPVGVVRGGEENLACLPGNRALKIITTNRLGQSVEWQFLFRRLHSDLPEPLRFSDDPNISLSSFLEPEYYDVVNLIAWNMSTGATCFLDGKPNVPFYKNSETGRVTNIAREQLGDADAIDKRVKELESQDVIVRFGVKALSFPDLADPSKANIIIRDWEPMFADCSRCHNAHSITRTPWIIQVLDKNGERIVQPPRKQALARAAGVRGRDVIGKQFERYWIVERNNLRRRLAELTKQPEKDAQPYSLTTKILDIKSNDCRTCHEIGSRHHCAESVAMAFGLDFLPPDRNVPNGFEIEYTPPEVFRRRLYDYFDSQTAKTWPDNGWHNRILGIKTGNETGKINKWTPHLKEVLDCCLHYQGDESLPEKCVWVDVLGCNQQ